jgi:uncharacterized membrane protein
MTRIAATEDRVLHVKATAEKAYAFFSQAEQFRHALEGVERCELLPGQRVRWVLKERQEKGIRFQPDYTVVLSGDGSQWVTWRFVEGNMRDEGEVWIRSSTDGGCEIRYRQTVEPDLPITPLMAQLIKPLVVRELRNDVVRFLDRAHQYLSN